MNPRLPQPHEARQLHRLRSLRVQRAQEQCTRKQAEVDAAVRDVHARQRKIETCRREIDQLNHAVVTSLAPHLPRWSWAAMAQRDRLADRLERDEYALIDDEQALEEAQERLQEARAALTRAMAREDAVGDLVQETRRAHALAKEQRAEREIEDQAPAPCRSAA